MSCLDTERRLESRRGRAGVGLEARELPLLGAAAYQLPTCTQYAKYANIGLGFPKVWPLFPYDP
eukprot:4119089-Prymnesium_polylepis.1